jgi:hypothetical protein
VCYLLLRRIDSYGQPHESTLRLYGIEPGALGIEDLLTMHDNDHNRRGHIGSHSHKKAAKSSAKGYAKF